MRVTKTDDYAEGYAKRKKNPSTQQTDYGVRDVKMEDYSKGRARPKKARRRAQQQNAPIEWANPGGEYKRTD